MIICVTHDLDDDDDDDDNDDDDNDNVDDDDLIVMLGNAMVDLMLLKMFSMY